MAKKTILLGEDEKDVAEMYKIAFEGAGFEVLLALDGEEVVKMAKEKRPDALLLDINMPKKDGFAVLKEASEEKELYDALKTAPIIMLTNYSNSQDIDYCMKNGAQDFIVKAEWKPKQIVEKVINHLK